MSTIPDGYTEIRHVYSPDDGGWYAVKSKWSETDGWFDECSSRDIYPSKDDLLIAISAETIEWDV